MPLKQQTAFIIMQKGLDSRKGITPVIAIILLLLITISMVGVSFMFMQRITQTATQTGEQQLSQQISQIGSLFSIEGVDKNKVYIRSRGSTAITGNSLAFFVNNVKVDSDNPTIAPGAIGTVALNDAQLAQLPDPAELKVTSAGFSDTITADFYSRHAVGYWKFDEGSGTVAKDSSGNGNDGTLMNSPAWVDGKYGKALQFDGRDDYADLGTSPSLDLGNIFSISAWFYLNADLPASGSSNWIYDGGDRPGIYFSGKKLRFYSYHITWDDLDSISDIDVRKWYHVVVVWDGSTKNIYLNGQLDTSRNNANAQTLGTATKYIAQRYSGSYFFNGIIDEVRILNVARSMTIS